MQFFTYTDCSLLPEFFLSSLKVFLFFKYFHRLTNTHFSYSCLYSVNHHTMWNNDNCCNNYRHLPKISIDYVWLFVFILPCPWIKMVRLCNNLPFFISNSDSTPGLIWLLFPLSTISNKSNPWIQIFKVEYTNYDLQSEKNIRYNTTEYLATQGREILCGVLWV